MKTTALDRDNDVVLIGKMAIVVHYSIRLRIPSVMSIDTWGEKTFLYPLQHQAKLLAAPLAPINGPALSSRRLWRQLMVPHFLANFQGGGGRVGVKGAGPASPPMAT